MSNLQLLKRQHKEIGDIIKKLEELVSQDVVAKSFDISMSIALLAGKLTIHLNSEDKYLYPDLLQHQDAKVQQVSKQFSAEMGNLFKAFANYKNMYMLSQNIKRNPTVFLDETKVIISAIKKRVEHEEKDLYPLLSA